jgi:hypothetical protein
MRERGHEELREGDSGRELDSIDGPRSEGGGGSEPAGGQG